MTQRRRIYYSSAQRSEIWDRWQAGESMSSTGRRIDRESSSVFSVISPTGDIRPPVRQRPKQARNADVRYYDVVAVPANDCFAPPKAVIPMKSAFSGRNCHSISTHSAN